MTLRIGIIGCGGIGRTHMHAWLSAGYRPVAVCDAIPAVAHDLAQLSDATVYSDGTTMLANAQLDVVSICTPPALHAELTIAALDRHIAVLCEKPMAPTIAECDAMIAAATRNQTLLSVGFCHRYQPHIEVMKAQIGAGMIGDVIMFRNRFAGHMPNVEQRWFSNRALAGGGVMVDTCVHSVDLFRHLIGDVARVQASAVTRTTSLGPALQVEDTAVITLTSTEGVLGVIEASWRTPPGEWIVSVYGTAGSLTLDYDTLELWHCDAHGHKQHLAVPDGDRFVNEVAHIAACVRDATPPRVTMADGRAACDILVRAMHDAQREE
ncbi:MAG: gfo/Idh/MocA family oxidoreductase [Chloroflexia bacterium]|nr:gfo/Idh/MocA family oxidoreductase [Chloroflexia bacterium]